MYDIWNVVLTYNLSQILFSFDSALSRTALSQQKLKPLCRIASFGLWWLRKFSFAHSLKLCKIFDVAFCKIKIVQNFPNSSIHDIKMCEKFRKTTYNFFNERNNIRVFLFKIVRIIINIFFLPTLLRNFAKFEINSSKFNVKRKVESAFCQQLQAWKSVYTVLYFQYKISKQIYDWNSVLLEGWADFSFLYKNSYIFYPIIYQNRHTRTVSNWLLNFGSGN